MNRNWTIRPATELDFADITIAESAVGPEPVSERETREYHSLAMKDKECPVEWLVAIERDGSATGRFLGFGEWGKAHWLAPDEREIHVSVPPANRGMGVGTYLLEHLEALARRNNPKAIYAWGKGHDPDSLKWAQNRGYAIERHRTEGVLDLSLFDSGRFQADLEEVRLAGISVATKWDDQADPYLPGIYRVDVECCHDLPGFTAEYVEPAYETWLLGFKESSAHKLFAFALCGDEVVGFTSIWMPQMEGQRAGIGATGVLRAHRGKGIAFAVKVAAATEAARAGAKRIVTHNDPDNPAILHLNEKMGFRSAPGPVILKKSLVTARRCGCPSS